MTNQEQYEIMCNIYEMTTRKMNNKEWVDFLTKQFDVSRSTAKDMLHAMMKIKKKDNLKKQKFNVEVWQP